MDVILSAGYTFNPLQSIVDEMLHSIAGAGDLLPQGSLPRAAE